MATNNVKPDPTLLDSIVLKVMELNELLEQAANKGIDTEVSVEDVREMPTGVIMYEINIILSKRIGDTYLRGE